MTGPEDPHRREHLSASDVERTDRVMQLAWLSLPPAHRWLLEASGASQWQVVDEPLGASVAGFLHSAGHQALTRPAQSKLDRAQGVWIQELRIVLVDAGHAKLAGLDRQTYEAFIGELSGLAMAQRTNIVGGRGSQAAPWQPHTVRAATLDSPTGAPASALGEPAEMPDVLLEFVAGVAFAQG